MWRQLAENCRYVLVTADRENEYFPQSGEVLADRFNQRGGRSAIVGRIDDDLRISGNVLDASR